MTDCMLQYKRGLKAANKTTKASPHPGEVWWVSNLDNVKDRPILVLYMDGDLVVFRKCTSQTSDFRKRELIEDYLEAGLEKATYVDPDIRRIERSRLVRRLGKLSEWDASKFNL